MRVKTAIKVIESGRPSDPRDGDKWDQAIRVLKTMVENKRKSVASYSMTCQVKNDEQA